MKKLFIVFVCCIVFNSPSAGAETLKLATGEWAPYTSEEMEGHGFITEIITQVFQEMGMEADYQFAPWQRCYSLVLRGKVWAAFPYSYTEERAKEVFFSDTIGESTTKFFYYKTDHGAQYETLEDLKPYKIGGVKGYFYEEEFEEAGLDVSYTSNETSSLKKLRAGRIDFMPLNELVGRALVKEEFPGIAHEFGALPPPHSVAELKLIVSKEYPNSKALLEQFNDALKKVKTTDAYRKILTKYGVEPPAE